MPTSQQLLSQYSAESFRYITGSLLMTPPEF